MANNPDSTGDLPRLPDFNVMAQCIRDIGNELAKAYVHTMHTLSEINAKFDAQNARFEAMERNVIEKFDQVNQRFDQITTRLERLEQKQAASVHNSVARLKNPLLESPDDAMHPHPRTDNTPINGFPDTSGTFNAMTDRDISLMLIALDCPTSGDITEKRERLRAMASAIREGLAEHDGGRG